MIDLENGLAIGFVCLDYLQPHLQILTYPHHARFLSTIQRMRRLVNLRLRRRSPAPRKTLRFGDVREYAVEG
jgi:hypothetical protein